MTVFFIHRDIYSVEYNVNTMNDKNKKAKRSNFLKGRLPHIPSQTNGSANIRINSESAIPKLRELAQKYVGITDPRGFITDLSTILGIPNSQGPSRYGEVIIPKEDGSILRASLRITNHQTNAVKYIENNANYEYNLSIVVRHRERKNTFIPHKDVKLDEYVYYGKRIKQVENPLSQIINSIIGFLQTGEYNDTTGVAYKNTSPTNENKELKTNKNMAKNKIRITENELKQIVSESVKSVLSELDWHKKQISEKRILFSKKWNFEKISSCVAEILEDEYPNNKYNWHMWQYCQVLERLGFDQIGETKYGDGYIFDNDYITIEVYEEQEGVFMREITNNY